MRTISAVATAALLSVTPVSVARSQEATAQRTFSVTADQLEAPGVAPPELAGWQQPLAAWAGLDNPSTGQASDPKALVWVSRSAAHLGVAISNPSPDQNALVDVTLRLKPGVWRLELAASEESGTVRAWRAGGKLLAQTGSITKKIFVRAGETLFVRAVDTLAEAEAVSQAAQAAEPTKFVVVRAKLKEVQALAAQGKTDRVLEKVHDALALLDGVPGPSASRLRAALSEISAATLNVRIQARVEGEKVKLLLVNDSLRTLAAVQFQWGPKIQVLRGVAPKQVPTVTLPLGKMTYGLVQYRLGAGTATLTTRVGPGTELPLVFGSPAPLPVAPNGKPTPKPTRPAPTPTPTPAPRTKPNTTKFPIVMNYPTTRTVEQTDTYHGTTVPDPYRWLEDPNAAETQAWVEAQNTLTSGYLKTLASRETLQKRLTELWNYERYGIPSRHGSRYVYSRNDGLQNQAVYYVADSLDAEPRVLIDPNTLSKDGTVALGGMSFSEDGSLLAYALSSSGSDWQEWHVRDVATGQDRSDLIKWAKFTRAEWTHDGLGFYYSRYVEPKEGEAFQGANRNHQLYYHRLGTPQSADTLVYERPDHPEWNLGAQVTDDGKWLVIYATQGTERRNRLFYKDLTQPDSAVRPLLAAGDASYSVIGNDGSVFYLLTDKEAPLKKVVAYDSQKGELRTVVEASQDTLQGASLFGEKLLLTYLKSARTQVRLFDLQGNLIREVALPGIGTASGFGGRRSETETFFAFSSYTTPTSIYRYDLEEGVSTLFKAPKVAFDPRQYETKQVFATSKDGTKVPMFLTYRKGLVLDGKNPVLLYGYGGFNIPLTPGFSVSSLVWMEQGGIYAVANLRGGGEFGKDWYEAGTKLRKQNVFDDFIGCAEWLIKEKYTQPAKLAIMGGSNGGLLVGACMTQRPELFAAALPAVGVLDMLRFDKFTIGWAWKSDYGDPANEADFKALLAYSPYHNLKPGTRYPATLVTTSDHDDRVVPAHSFKFAARLQASQAPAGPPTLIRIETKAGHGAGKPTAKIIEEQADVYAFLIKALGMTP